MTVLLSIALGVSLTVAAMLATWLVQRRTHNAAIVDITWTLLLGALALLYAATGGGDPAARVVMAVVAVAWSARLGLHLARRVVGAPEDGRYRELRERWGDHADRKMLVFFLIQGLLDVLLATSFLVVAWDPRPLAPARAALALAIAAIAIGGEAFADAQLAAHKADPANRGKTCRSGLWRYSRHPNYFFEWLHWLVYPILAMGAPWWILTGIAPILLLFFLLRVTGIPATEAQALKSRGDDYRRYQRTTSAFVPWFPREARP